MPKEFKVDVSKAVGHVFPPDILDVDFGPLPTYPLCLLLKSDDWDVNSFMERWSVGGDLPGVPSYDFNKIVHGEQSFEVIRPFPVKGGYFKSIRSCVGVYDKGSGMVIDSAVDLYGKEDGLHYCRMGSKMFVRGYGGWNGPKGPKAVVYNPPQRDPDVTEIFKTAPNQALLYRLSGDFNPLHADIDLAPTAGFPRPILHGLCSYGKCAHSILKHFGDNDRTRLKTIEARFAQPVLPGETIEILMWKVDDKDPTLIGVIFQACVKERNAFVLTNGYATLTKEILNSKL
ncbi:HotDog domain-containing protein [Gilbertella persicaria]|uniref:HotDog domain-containing protein n=1 Tax=Gilbertella persicaria TaxID=101096 RepID=UPI00221E7051|nr:HotDog domain-containing protein [Gilbertella persicaria]KAI8055593.1 HotDog domain-containing protein [Gilbertella persicaria]